MNRKKRKHDKKVARPWIRWGRGGIISNVEKTVGDMLFDISIRFYHRRIIRGQEVDFLIPRPGQPGLIIEVDGDLYHMDERH